MDVLEQIIRPEYGILTNIGTAHLENFNTIEDLIKDIYKQINQISNNGNNVTDIFTNKFYVNDFMQDREIAKANKETPNNSIKNRDEYTLKELRDKLYPNDPLY